MFRWGRGTAVCVISVMLFVCVISVMLSACVISVMLSAMRSLLSDHAVVSAYLL